MSDKVIGLDRKPIEEVSDVNHGVVTLLERILGEARAGRISGAAVVYTVPEGEDISFQSDWSGPKVTMLGALARALYAMNRTLDQQDTGRIGES